jgi:peptidoglycan/LPS O-acetylase OafA/YrhL
VPANATSGRAAVCALSSERIPELDGLRAVAVLLVVVWHYLDTFSSAWLTPFRLGWSGVDLFFVLSGFLIGGILLDNRSRQSYFKPFYGRRIHRIFPLYYAWVAFVLVLHMPADAPRWSYAVFAQNFFIGTHPRFDSVWIGHTWSLAIEEQFYLLAPLLIRFVPSRMLPWLAAAVLAGAPVCRSLTSANWPLAANMMTPGRADTLVFGVVAAALVRHPASLAWLERHRRLAWKTTSTMGLPMIYLSLHFRSISSMHPLWYSVIAVAYTCLLLSCVVNPPALASRFLRARALQKMGALSFAIYIFHLPVFAAVHNVTGSRLLGCLIGGAATLALAQFSSDYFEGPLLRRGRKKYRYT